MEPVTELNTIIMNRKIPNALLFTGSCGEEKKRVAITFVKTINCLCREFDSNPLNSESQSDYTNREISSDTPCSTSQSDCHPCNSCRSCTKIDAAMHPDIITVATEQDKAVIRIGQIRALCSAIASKPHEAKVRMVMVEDAHTMNMEAANALLKILEEPPERTFFILLARSLNDLLPTVISRCRHIRFRPVASREVAKRLTLEWNVPPSVAMIAAMSSSGDMEKAMMFANVRDGQSTIESVEGAEVQPFSGTDWISRRYWILNQILLIIKPGQSRSSLFLYALALAEKLSSEVLLIKDSLSMIKLWFRDMALIRYDKNHIINSDFIHALSESAALLPEEYPLAALESIHGVEMKIESNGSLRLTLENLFLSLIPKHYQGARADLC